jgi:hypothetical protein
MLGGAFTLPIRMAFQIRGLPLWFDPIRQNMPFGGHRATWSRRVAGQSNLCGTVRVPRHPTSRRNAAISIEAVLGSGVAVMVNVSYIETRRLVPWMTM